jgi:hypothetical protein
MNTKRLIGVGAGAALAAALGIPGLGGSAVATGGESFTVYAAPGGETSVDAGKPGFSPGDMDLHSSPLTRSGKVVGYNTGSCLTTAVTKQHLDQVCQIVLSLPAGQIVTEGAVRSGKGGPGTFPLAITGGTGRYQTARGQVHVTASDGPVRIDVTLVR